jgi:hypothetical protein
LPADGWVDTQPRRRRVDGPAARYTAAGLANQKTTVDFFGDHVAFDKLAWRKGVAS